MVHYKLG